MDQKMGQLISTDTLPAQIRSGKSIVFYEVPSNSSSEAERVNRVAHLDMTKGGIDPVVYYDIDVVFGGVEVTRSFIEDFSKRELSNIILIQYRGPDSRIAVLEFNDDFFTGTKVKAWTRQGELKNIVDQLFVRASNSGYPLQNLLTAELPEVGALTTPLKGRRAEFFNLSLSAGKLAVPKFGDPLIDQELQAAFCLAYPNEFLIIYSGLSVEEIK